MHYIDRADVKTIDLLKNAPETELYNVSGFAHYTAPMHCDTAPFDKVEVRQAIKWAINRQDLVDKILYGYGSPGNDNPLSPSLKYAINAQNFVASEALVRSTISDLLPERLRAPIV